MSKTNHRRGFTTPKDSERYRGSPCGSTGEVSLLADRSIGAGFGGDNSQGHAGFARVKRGAKKYVRTRVRFHENAATQSQAREAAAQLAQHSLNEDGSKEI
jgi:hypothetical protein